MYRPRAAVIPSGRVPGWSAASRNADGEKRRRRVVITIYRHKYMRLRVRFFCEFRVFDVRGRRSRSSAVRRGRNARSNAQGGRRNHVRNSPGRRNGLRVIDLATVLNYVGR